MFLHLSRMRRYDTRNFLTPENCQHYNDTECIVLIIIVQPYCPVVGWRRQHAVSTSAYLGLSSVSSHLVRLSNVSPIFL